MSTDPDRARTVAPLRTLGTFGLWASRAVVTAELARAAEDAGFGALWVGGTPGSDLAELETALEATSELVVASGVVNIRRHGAAPTAASFHRLEQRFPGRTLLGVGSGHPESGIDVASPLTAMRDYLDALDALGVPAHRRIVSALGPRMLELAARRSLGSHPYLTVPAHTRWAREVLGPAALLAPEVMIVPQSDAAAARAVGRAALLPYLRLSNYTRTMARAGFGPADLAGDGSDAVIDAHTHWGGPADLVGALQEHLDAGASHVCAQLLPADGEDLAAAVRSLGAELLRRR